MRKLLGPPRKAVRKILHKDGSATAPRKPDPPAGPAAEVFEPTEQQAPTRRSEEETPQDPSKPSPLRSSCWAMAREHLKTARPAVYKEWEKIESQPEDESQNDPAGLLNLATSSIRGKKEIPREVEKAIRFVLQFKELVAAGANFDPHRVAPVVWRGFCVVLEACLGESKLHQDAVRDLVVISSNLSYWANVESSFLGTKTRSDILKTFEPLESELIELYAEILALEVELVKLGPGRVIVQVLMTSVRDAAWRNLVANIAARHDSCKTTFARCKNEIDQHVEVKNWILGDRPEAAHSDALKRTGVGQKYQTCGQWLLDDTRFTNWSSKKPGSGCRVLWLRGTTGTGKSTLLARIIQWHLDRASLYPRLRFAYFYCSRGSDLKSKHSYENVLRSLLRQAAYDPVTGEISEHALEAWREAGGGSGDVRPFPFDTGYNDLLHRILRSGVRLRVMIDALDECDEPEELLNTLRDASEVIPGGLELLVSSRHEVDVIDKFQDAVLADLNKSTRKTDMDMVTYIKAEVSKPKKGRLLKGNRQDLEDRLIEILCGRAGGMFRWVQLQLSFFLNRERAFSHPDDVQFHLNRLDTGSVAGEEDLNTAYDDIFKRNTTDQEVASSHARKIYRMLLCCKTTLSISAIATAIAFNEDNGSKDKTVDPGYILRVTQDFVVETASGTLDFAHVSVKDYLRRVHQSDYSDSQCHAQVAKMCIKYISSQDKDVYRHTLPSDAFLSYSHEFWGEHCAALSKEDRRNLRVSGMLLDWLLKGSGSTKFRDWLHTDVRSFDIPLTLCVSDSCSPIFAACTWNLVEVLEKILSTERVYDLNLNSTNGRGITPLSLAALRGHKAVVTLLLEKGANVDAKDNDGWTPLSWAASHGHNAVVTLLLEKGANINAEEYNDGRTPLACAASEGHKAIVTLLLKKGPNINAKDKWGRTSLISAALEGHNAIVTLLLERGGDIDAKDNNGRTSLLWAAMYGQNAVVTLLLEKGADINAKDNDGRTSLIWAALKGRNAIMTLLLEKGGDIDAKDNNGRTSLWWADKNGHEAVVEMLQVRSSNNISAVSAVTLFEDGSAELASE